MCNFRLGIRVTRVFPKNFDTRQFGYPKIRVQVRVIPKCPKYITPNAGFEPLRGWRREILSRWDVGRSWEVAATSWPCSMVAHDCVGGDPHALQVTSESATMGCSAAAWAGGGEAAASQGRRAAAGRLRAATRSGRRRAVRAWLRTRRLCRLDGVGEVRDGVWIRFYLAWALLVMYWNRNFLFDGLGLGNIAG